MSKKNNTLTDASRREPDSVKAMFTRVAPFYDFINRAMTFGLDIIWRRRLVRALELPEGESKVVDIACGSGDVALEVARKYPQAKITCSDFCAPMLDIAREKFAKNFPNRAEFIEADCSNLPFESNAFSGATVSFGFRNFKDRQACLLEISRVLKPNAKLCVLEVSKANGIFRVSQKFFMGIFVPFLASLCGGNKADYVYLAKTTLEYPSAQEVEAMFGKAGFENVSTRAMAFGLVAITSGRKK